jgi:MFS family permease
MNPAPKHLSLFLNLAHTLDHLLMLVFTTAVIAMAPEFGKTYGELLTLSLGGFIAFGVCSLPAGWLADRWSRRNMMAVFFFGIGISVLLTGLAQSTTQIAVGLTFVGVFAAIYHPVGIAMLVSYTDKVGKTLGVNGVYGNVGVAFAAIAAGALSDVFGWRAAFIVPGIIALIIGVLFVTFVPSALPAPHKSAAKHVSMSNNDMRRIFIVLMLATICGGLIFNATTISMPKLFDERLHALTQTTTGIGTLVAGVYLFAAMAQLLVGRMLDKYPLRNVFLGIVALQAPLLFIAANLQNYALLAVALAMMFFIFGQIPINDAMIARYVADEWRSRAYALRYLVSFSASATAVPLVAYLHRGGGGFEQILLVLAAFALVNFIGALSFPVLRNKSIVVEGPVLGA